MTGRKGTQFISLYGREEENKYGLILLLPGIWKAGLSTWGMGPFDSQQSAFNASCISQRANGVARGRNSGRLFSFEALQLLLLPHQDPSLHEPFQILTPGRLTHASALTTSYPQHQF